MPERTRWIVAGVVAVALLAGVVALRHSLRGPEPEPEAVVPARIPTRGKKPPVRPDTEIEAHASRSRDSFDTSEEDAPVAAAGTVPVVRATPAAKRQPRAATAMQGQMEAAPGEVAGEVAAETPGKGPSEGAALSVSFDGSAAAADQTQPLIADGLEFDRATGSARFGPSAQLAYPDSGGVNPDESTVAFWIRMEWDPHLRLTKPLMELVTNTWENRIEIGMGPTFIRLLLTTSDGSEQGVGASVNWAPGEWHHVAAVWGQALMSFYVDGLLKDEKPYTGSVVIPPDTPLYVGSTRRTLQDQGTVSLRGWTVYPQSLAADEIAMLATQNPPPQ